MITYILIIVAAILAAMLGFSVYLNIRLGRVILTVEEQVEESLDILDESFKRISNIAALELFSDEPVVRDLVQSIQGARFAVLQVANKLIVLNPDSTQETDDDDTTDSSA